MLEFDYLWSEQYNNSMKARLKGHYFNKYLSNNDQVLSLVYFYIKQMVFVLTM